jgi:N-carbamoylputrescine amidase
VRSYHLGLAQLDCSSPEVGANLANTVEAIDTAANAGASLVVLPELAASGYRLDRQTLLASAESVERPGPILRAWSERARQHHVAVVGGFAEEVNGELFNAAAVIGSDGTIVGTYQKLHLFGDESKVFAAGRRGLPIFDVGDVRLGVALCYDLRFPEVLRILALRGADVVAVPTAWVSGFDVDVPAPTESIGQVDGVYVQAKLNGTFVACADQVGTTAPHTFLGRSVCVDPFGRPLLGPMGANTPGTFVVEVDIDQVRAARERSPGMSPLSDRRADVYGELLGYDASLWPAH